MVQWKEQIKAWNVEQSNEEITNLSDAEFKTLVIRMLTEKVEYGCKIEKKVKAMQSEIKKNIQGTNSDRKETGTQINDLEKKEKEKNRHSTRTEWRNRIQKEIEENLRNLWDNCKCSNIQIIEVPEGEEEE